ncbi:subtilisin-like protease 3, putative [Plasmodium chabaudi chabaudi]|uniref:subtilisin n=1 Tax=Plasmodium chabaudi chabaudi TaxID=31271 RepID=A0A4V0K8F0_PLACU|nr:subtilisin-like protease 3, putative [Plasmodium chabaudi chabaudi]VTZ69061.1 subtilisin-like protease 3, putative [Plasmodium chabaudi chabaudi]|eukprot:XP_745443.2 subtilisin-like protease 3, putative [Plasmodium chabaudi chabaudi]
MRVKYFRYMHIWSLIYNVWKVIQFNDVNTIYNSSADIIDISKQNEIKWGRTNIKIRILNQTSGKELEINKDIKTNIHDIFSSTDNDNITDEMIMKNYKNVKKKKLKKSKKIHKLIISFKNENKMLNNPNLMNKPFLSFLNYCGKIKKLENTNLYLYDITSNKNELLVKFCLYALKNSNQINIEADYKLNPGDYAKLLKKLKKKKKTSLHSEGKEQTFHVNNSSMFKKIHTNLKKYNKTNIVEECNDISEVAKGVKLSSLYEKQNVNVCIIDTGIDYGHTNLKESIIDMKATEGNYYHKKKQNNKYNFSDISNPLDKHGHGTFIAGIVAGNANMTDKDTKEGIQGINKMAKLIICKALNNNNVGNVSDILDCFDYCSEKNAKIINASFSSTKNYPSLYYAMKELERKGIFVVTSSGNCIQKSDDSPNGQAQSESNKEIMQRHGHTECNLNLAKLYPSAYSQSLTNLLVISNIIKDSNNDIVLSNDSCYSNKYVHFGVPGNDILSTHINNQYATSSGSSFSAAVVTGAISLLLSINPNFNNKEIIELIQKAIVPVNNLKDKVKWGGYLNVHSLVKLAIEKMQLELKD